jgi:hypothetical protein
MSLGDHYRMKPLIRAGRAIATDHEDANHPQQRTRPMVVQGNRHFLLHCELDAAPLYLYGMGQDGVCYIMETFPTVKRKDEAKHGEFRT